jgi:hypothetical protein
VWLIIVEVVPAEVQAAGAEKSCGGGNAVSMSFERQEKRKQRMIQA